MRKRLHATGSQIRTVAEIRQSSVHDTKKPNHPQQYKILYVWV